MARSVARRRLVHVVADIGEIVAEIESLDLAGAIQPLMRAGNGGNAGDGLLQLIARLLCRRRRGLQAEHAGDELQAVGDPVIAFLKQKLLLLQRRLEIALEPLAFDRHAQQVGGAAQEGDVVLGELPFGTAVDLENPPRLALALEDHVHRPVNAMDQQQCRRAEPILVAEMVGDHGLTGLQREPGWRFQAGADDGMTDHTRTPADPGPHQECFLVGEVFERLGKLCLHAFGDELDRTLDQFGKRCSLQGQDAEFGEDLLLPQAHPKGAGGDRRPIVTRRCFDQRLWIGERRHAPNVTPKL